MTLRAVTFDFWQTLASEPHERFLHGARVRAWEELLAASGVPRSREEIERVFEEVARHHSAQWRAGRLFGAADAATRALQELAPDVDDATAGRLVEAFADAGAGVELRLTPNIRDALAALDDAGVRLGIVCDVGFTSGAHLRDFLDRSGVLGHFDGWAFSDEVGAYKPDAAIFRHALERIGGIEPAAAAHIGDLRRTDVAGSRAIGMTSIRYRGVSDDPPEDGPEADHVLDDHAHLVDLLRNAGLLAA